MTTDLTEKQVMLIDLLCRLAEADERMPTNQMIAHRLGWKSVDVSNTMSALMSKGVIRRKGRHKNKSVLIVENGKVLGPYAGGAAHEFNDRPETYGTTTGSPCFRCGARPGKCGC